LIIVETRYPFERKSSTGAIPVRLQFVLMRERPLLDQLAAVRGNRSSITSSVAIVKAVVVYFLAIEIIRRGFAATILR
jgi:hypothetical protein